VVTIITDAEIGEGSTLKKGKHVKSDTKECRSNIRGKSAIFPSA
jgi:hypothetical protein